MEFQYDDQDLFAALGIREWEEELADEYAEQDARTLKSMVLIRPAQSFLTSKHSWRILPLAGSKYSCSPLTLTHRILTLNEMDFKVTVRTYTGP